MPEVYSIDLTEVECAPVVWLSVLDDSEILRANSFFQPRDRLAFVAAHALKRIVLAETFSNQCAKTLQFNTNGFGKPFLSHKAAPQFNLSHTTNLIALAISLHATVGIDVEALGGAYVSRSSMQFMLTLEERAELDAAPDWKRAFLTLWTAKEAVVKAEGVGLSQPVSEIRIEQMSATGLTQRWALWQSMPTSDHILTLAWNKSSEVVNSHSLSAADLTNWISRASCT